MNGSLLIIGAVGLGIGKVINHLSHKNQIGLALMILSGICLSLSIPY